jgi:hypothetical protein
MEFKEMFLQRYGVLYDFYLEGNWNLIPKELMRQRPHPRVNSIAWIIWHMTRVEDAGLNRFVTDGTQVLDQGDWINAMNLPYRHNGGEMTFAEVDELSQQVNLEGLHEYSRAVQAATRKIVKGIENVNLSDLLTEEHVRKVAVEEGLAFSGQEGMIQNYTGWSKGRCLMTYGLTHGFQHLGEIETIATLLGIVYE